MRGDVKGIGVKAANICELSLCILTKNEKRSNWEMSDAPELVHLQPCWILRP